MAIRIPSVTVCCHQRLVAANSESKNVSLGFLESLFAGPGSGRWISLSVESPIVHLLLTTNSDPKNAVTTGFSGVTIGFSG